MVNIPQKYAFTDHEYVTVVLCCQIHIKISELKSVDIWCNIFGDCLSFRFHPLHSVRVSMVLLFNQMLSSQIFRSYLLVHSCMYPLYQLIHPSFLWINELYQQLYSFLIFQNRYTADELWANSQYDLLKANVIFIGSTQRKLVELVT